MTFAQSIRTVFSKYADFKGCAGLSEFWWWVLFTVLATVCLELIHHSLSLAFSVATLLPGLAVTARRLHDTNRSGWLQLIGLIPVLGWIALIVMCAQEGRRPNRFETQPRTPAALP